MYVDGRNELEAVLGDLLAMGAPPTPKTLDLIGHSTPGTSLQTIGDWVLDAGNPTVTAIFRELADQRLLPRLGIQAVRLLGCLTADTGHGRWTISTLAHILGVEVYGTTDLIYSAHYDARGLRAGSQHLLVSSRDLRRAPRDPDEAIGSIPASRYPRLLDVDALPSFRGTRGIQGV